MNSLHSPVRTPSNLPWLIALFLLIVCGRTVFVSLFAESVPYWDQWDSEGALLLKPWVEGNLRLADLFSAHNEHRILFTRLISLALFEANQGQWDNLVAVYANIFVYAAVAALLYLALSRSTAAWIERTVLLVALVILAWLPYGHTNSLISFQNQFYLMAGFAMATIAVAAYTADRFMSMVWVVALAMAGLFTMASGLLAAVAAGGVLMARAWRGGLRWRTALAGTAALAMVAVAGYLLVPHIDGHDPLKAADPAQWFRTFVLHLGWPFGRRRLGAIIVWAPFAVTAWRFLFHRGTRADELMALGLGAWVILQCAAIGYSRGSESSVVGARYVDILAVGVVVNLWLAVRLGQGWLQSRPSSVRWLGPGAVTVYGLLILTVMLRHTPIDLNHARAKNAVSLIQTENVRRFVFSADASTLDQPFMDIPYPDRKRLAGLLSDPTLRELLPASVRAPIAVGNGTPSGDFRVGPADSGYAFSSCTRPRCESGTGQWQGPEMRSRYSQVLVPLSAGGNPEGLSLRLGSEAGKGADIMVEPKTPNALLPVPPGRPFQLQVTDSTTEGWLAFDSPTEIAPLSAVALDLQAALRRLFDLADRGTLRHFVALPVAANVEGMARQVDDTRPLGGTFDAPRSGFVRSFSVFIGNYHGASDGILNVEVCSARACTHGARPLATSSDNSSFAMELSDPIWLQAGTAVEFRIVTEGASHPLAIWTYPPKPGSPRLQAADASTHTLRAGLIYLD
ncbi:hypothetical protein [Pseudoxanthomonas wuyuanensis]|uniref:Uncharacterized protein n=1 Tax=Pseudoxanthomonas wuyuanensis TaxID=1073196 RepID=A0A286DAF2_9GAMM|nr:hypothetical protein [Pseudoxanthomonas wuyuanensis]SOD55612.1 hypothetical protein SAMN06296416_107212 [Pseudoxanthomonas wuyuanensis]